MSDRDRSAWIWVAAALVVVAVVGVLYLRPSLTPPPAPNARPPASSDDLLGGASFADANRGEVVVIGYPVRQGSAPIHYATPDGGRTWSRGGDVEYAPPMAFDWGGAGGSARISADGGRTWRPLAVPEAASRTTSPTFLDARHGWWLVRAGTPDQPQQARLWRTEDGGGSWQRLAGLGLPDGAALLGFRWMDPVRGVLAIIAARPALYRTEDGGETWSPSLTPESPLPGTRSFVVWPLAVRGRLLAWLAAFPQEQFDAIGRSTTSSVPNFDVFTYTLGSTDGGRTWGPPMAGPHLQTSTIGPPAVDSAGRLLLLDGRRLWVSEDFGATWSARVVQAPSGVTPDALVEATGGALFATAYSDRIPTTDVRFVDRLLRSTDGGAHWEPVPLP
jgi:photosystem II stability/assembly factor-like uncharacterized protein